MCRCNKHLTACSNQLRPHNKQPVPDASLFAAVPLTSLLKELFKDEYKASYMHHNQGLPNSNKCVTSGAKHPRVAHKPADTSSGSHPLSTPLHTFGRSFCIPEKAFKQASHTRRHASNLTTTERSLLLQFVMVGTNRTEPTTSPLLKNSTRSLHSRARN